jgi:heme A synthase
MEWGHRTLAACAAALIVATVFVILRSPAPPESALKRSGRFLLGLLGLQILLGGTTVLLGLSVAVSTIHLIVATIVLSGLITVASVMTWGTPVVRQPSDKVRRLAVAGLGAMLVQLALGAVVRHSHSGLACPNFPGCLESFLPIPLTLGTMIAFAHRWWGFILLGVFGHLAGAARKQSPELKTAARIALALSLIQVSLGIGTVLSALRTDARATHAACGYALWAVLFYIALRSGGFRWIWERPGHSSKSAPQSTGLTSQPAN